MDYWVPKRIAIASLLSLLFVTRAVTMPMDISPAIRLLVLVPIACLLGPALTLTGSKIRSRAVMSPTADSQDD